MRTECQAKRLRDYTRGISNGQVTAARRRCPCFNCTEWRKAAPGRKAAWNLTDPSGEISSHIRNVALDQLTDLRNDPTTENARAVMRILREEMREWIRTHETIVDDIIAGMRR